MVADNGAFSSHDEGQVLLSEYEVPHARFTRVRRALQQMSNVIEISRKDREFLDGVVALRDPESAASKDIAFWGWMWSQAALPHKNPGIDVDVWGRRNGGFQLTIQSGVELDENNNKVYTGIPYGNIPRLLMAWMCSEAVRTKEPKLFLGESLNEFMKNVGIGPATGGRWGSITRLKEQMKRLFEARISYRWGGGSKYAGRARRDMQVSKEDVLWWSDRHPQQGTLFQSYVILSDDFFAELTKNPVPIKMEALKLLKQSPLALDLYTWICWRIYKVNQAREPAEIPWRALHKQFGSSYASPKEFARRCREYLRKIALLYPDMKFDTDQPGLLILKPSRCHVIPMAPKRKQR